MSENMDIDNCVYIVEEAQRLHLKNLYEACLEFITNNLDSIIV